MSALGQKRTLRRAYFFSRSSLPLHHYRYGYLHSTRDVRFGSKKRIDSAIDEAQAALRPLFYTMNGPDREQHRKANQ